MLCFFRIKTNPDLLLMEIAIMAPYIEDWFVYSSVRVLLWDDIEIKILIYSCLYLFQGSVTIDGLWPLALAVLTECCRIKPRDAEHSVTTQPPAPFPARFPSACPSLSVSPAPPHSPRPQHGDTTSLESPTARTQPTDSCD